jgi:hypothetical protein
VFGGEPWCFVAIEAAGTETEMYGDLHQYGGLDGSDAHVREHTGAIWNATLTVASASKRLSACSATLSKNQGTERATHRPYVRKTIHE